jgi:hypothetical protein
MIGYGWMTDWHSKAVFEEGFYVVLIQRFGLAYPLSLRILAAGAYLNLFRCQA